MEMLVWSEYLRIDLCTGSYSLTSNKLKYKFYIQSIFQLGEDKYLLAVGILIINLYM